MTSLQPDIWQHWTTYLASAFNLMLSDDALRAFAVYHRELAAWNEKINLISVKTPEEILWRHFADSLAGTPALDEQARRRAAAPLRVADIGTGAGFPGLPLKIAHPDIELTLVESITKKCAFLEHIVTAIGLNGVRVINDRAENLGQDPAHRQRYDVVLSRAVSKFAPNLEIALPLVNVGGRALLYKTRSFADNPDEMKQGARALALLGAQPAGRRCYRLPTGEQEYCVLEFEKTTPTPPAYPRRPGVPEKKPL